MPSVEERVTMLEVNYARLEERVEDLEEYRMKQNGMLQKLDEKFDKIMLWIIGLLGGIVADLILNLLK